MPQKPLCTISVFFSTSRLQGACCLPDAGIQHPSLVTMTRQKSEAQQHPPEVCGHVSAWMERAQAPDPPPSAGCPDDGGVLHTDDGGVLYT